MTLQTTNNIHTNPNNRLSVQVSLTGLSFLVSSGDEERQVIEKKFTSSLTPEEILMELKSLLESNEAFSHDFDQVDLVYHSTYYTLVPESLFDESKASEYLKFNAKILGNDFIANDIIDNYGIQVVYIPYVNINNYLFERFGAFKFYHASTLLLKWVLDREKHSQSTKVYSYIGERQFDLIVLKNGALQLCNSFIYKTPEDFIYYLLFVFEQLGLNPDSIETVLFGNISKESPLFEIAYTYIRNVTIDTFDRDERIDSPLHFLHTVLAR